MPASGNSVERVGSRSPGRRCLDDQAPAFRLANPTGHSPLSPPDNTVLAAKAAIHDKSRQAQCVQLRSGPTALNHVHRHPLPHTYPRSTTACDTARVLLYEGALRRRSLCRSRMNGPGIVQQRAGRLGGCHVPCIETRVKTVSFLNRKLRRTRLKRG